MNEKLTSGGGDDDVGDGDVGDDDVGDDDVGDDDVGDGERVDQRNRRGSTSYQLSPWR